MITNNDHLTNLKVRNLSNSDLMLMIEQKKREEAVQKKTNKILYNMSEGFKMTPEQFFNLKICNKTPYAIRITLTLNTESTPAIQLKSSKGLGR